MCAGMNKLKDALIKNGQGNCGSGTAKREFVQSPAAKVCEVKKVARFWIIIRFQSRILQRAH